MRAARQERERKIRAKLDEAYTVLDRTSHGPQSLAAPGPGEVVLQIKASGMCGSDLKFYRAAPGAMQKELGLGDVTEPAIAGHEPCGVVVAVGEGVSEREARLGQRVMDHHYAGCGVCEHCRVGWSQLCREGSVVYGVTANGGAIDGPGPIVADGMVYVTSGYVSLIGRPGNVLLAFGID